MVATDTELARAASSGDPAEGLRAVRALRALADRLEALQVVRARDLGWTWQEDRVPGGREQAGRAQEIQRQRSPPLRKGHMTRHVRAIRR